MKRGRAIFEKMSSENGHSNSSEGWHYPIDLIPCFKAVVSKPFLMITSTIKIFESAPPCLYIYLQIMCLYYSASATLSKIHQNKSQSRMDGKKIL